MNLISLYTSFANVGGAQKMCLSIHKGIKKRLLPDKNYIISYTPFDKIHQDFFSIINKKNYIRFQIFKTISKNKDAIFISHHRKITTQLYLISRALKIDLKIIHVAHNEFTSYRRFTFFPKTVVAVSEGVRKNHENYFGLKNVQVIYNGIEDPKAQTKINFNPNGIKKLVPGRITAVKQQLRIVELLKDSLPKNISIYFAGSGPELEHLEKVIKGKPGFISLGHIDKMLEVYKQIDWVMLFSKKEGLPLSLIEGSSFGKPLICNDVGGNIEIMIDRYNGFCIKSETDVFRIIEIVSTISADTYKKMSQNSRNHFIKHFDRNTMIDSYLKVVDKLLHE